MGGGEGGAPQMGAMHTGRFVCRWVNYLRLGDKLIDLSNVLPTRFYIPSS